ncbi:hypothetical protein AS589_12985 [Empedobacter brevis]|nr:hypothetical protein AS589_12985 [Empedobacter brevis]
MVMVKLPENRGILLKTNRLSSIKAYQRAKRKKLTIKEFKVKFPDFLRINPLKNRQIVINSKTV